MPEIGPISLTKGNLAFDFPIWKIKAARWSAAQTRQGCQKVAGESFQGCMGERPPVSGRRSVCIPEGCQTTSEPIRKQAPKLAGRRLALPPGCVATRASCRWSAPFRPDRPPATFWQPCRVAVRLHVPTDDRRSAYLEMPNWHFKFGTRRNVQGSKLEP